MSKLTLEQLLKGIKSRDNRILTVVYRDFFPPIRSYILNNNGSEEDAKDVFQEALIVIFKSLRENKLEIKQSFEAFLMGTCKFIWLKILRNKDIHNRNVQEIEINENKSPLDDELIDEDIEARLFRKHFLNLGDDCKNLLKMTINGESNSKIAKMMGYKSEKFVSNKKARCKEYLAKMIKADPEYKNLKSD